MARAGGKDPEKLPDALAEAERLSASSALHAAGSATVVAWRGVKVLALDYGARAHRRRRLRSDRDAGAAARRRRAGASDAGLARARRARRRERGRAASSSGLPLTLRGERGEQAQETERFVEALRGLVHVPVETFDERFTTKIAAQAARRGGRGRARRRPSARRVSRPGWEQRAR